MDEVELIAQGLQNLWEAVNRLEKAMETYPGLSVRPRHFVIAPGIIWPGRRFNEIRVGRENTYFCGSWGPYKEVIQGIYQATRHRPREVLRAVRRLQAAAAWCDARVAGLERAWAELRRQQARAVEALEAEAALVSLVNVVRPR